MTFSRIQIVPAIQLKPGIPQNSSQTYWKYIFQKPFDLFWHL